MYGSVSVVWFGVGGVWDVISTSVVFGCTNALLCIVRILFVCSFVRFIYIFRRKFSQSFYDMNDRNRAFV